MALDHLLAALERDATRAAEQRMQDAEAEATRLRSAARAKADALRASAVQLQEQRLRGEIEQVLLAERRRLRAETLRRRQTLLDHVLSTVEAKLPKAALDPANRSGLGRDLDRALIYVNGVPAVVRTSPDLVGWARRALEGRPEITVEADAALTTGVTVTAVDGSVVIDATLATRLRQGWPELSMKLISWLVQPEGPCTGTT
jgi:vacuolar-type H+-ATPase subunit E/Vma4